MVSRFCAPGQNIVQIQPSGHIIKYQCRSVHDRLVETEDFRTPRGQVMVQIATILSTKSQSTVQDGSRSNSHHCLRDIPEFSTVNAAARFAINLPARAAINRWYLRR